MRTASSQREIAKPTAARRSDVGPLRRLALPVTSATGPLPAPGRASIHAQINRPGGDATPPARHRRLRLPCTTNLPAARPQATRPDPGCGGFARQTQLRLEVTIVPLPEPESNPLRARQLAVTVKLLQRAAAEASSSTRRHEP